ncbi:hypothetical protein ACHAWF_012908 [Thalassiosira exigua]
MSSATASREDEGEGNDVPEADKTAFPILLHGIVSDKSTDDCIHWLPCGTRFVISDKKKFAKDVLSRFYGPSKSKPGAKYTSFTRRLTRWSFTRVPRGPYLGAYYNENFRRDEPRLASRVRYDHSTPLSAGVLLLERAKAQAVAQAAAAKVGICSVGRAGEDIANGDANPPHVSHPLAQQLGIQGQGSTAATDLEALLRHQVQAMNAAGVNSHVGILGGTGQASQSGGVQNILQAVMAGQGQAGGNGGAFAALNGTVALQMALAQQTVQQRQAHARAQAAGQLVGAAGARGQGEDINMLAMEQARLVLAQQRQQEQVSQDQMSLRNQVQRNHAGGGQNIHDQRLLAAILAERLNQAQRQQQNQQQQANSDIANLPQISQGNLYLGSANSLASTVPSLVSANQGNISGLTLATIQSGLSVGNAAVNSHLSPASTNQINASSLTLATSQSVAAGGNAAINSHIFSTKPPPVVSSASLTTLQRGRPQAHPGARGPGNVNFPSANLGSLLGYTAELRGAGVPPAGTNAVGSAGQNQASMNAILAYLSRQAGGGGGNGAVGRGTGGGT